MKTTLTTMAIVAAATLLVGCDHPEPTEEELAGDQDPPIVGTELEDDATLREDDAASEIPEDGPPLLDTAWDDESDDSETEDLGNPEKPPYSDSQQDPPPLAPEKAPDDPS